MKRTISLLLIAVLLLATWPAALAEDTGAALPQVGDVIHGFEVAELRDYPLMDAVIVRFRHRQTGAELFYIANDDVNRAFDLTFFTEAVDNSGLPHVFEHATTSGSKKYPSSALWFNLEYQTYNTFMNAVTAKRFTSYPCASLSEAQLLKYADYFTDSCFNPTLMENDQVFRTEAWRYRLDDADAPLTIEGTVYSEMQGAWTLQRMANTNALRAMFPGSRVGNDSGGDPDVIPELTWDALKEYHRQYYHPSNCAAYLYGRFENYKAFLQLLDGYFSVYERREITRVDDGYAPIAAPVVQALSFPVEAGSDTEHVSEVYYGFVCPGLNRDREAERVMTTLTRLLADGASNFQQSLHEALPYGSFGVSMEMQGPEDAVVFAAANVNPEDAETFKTAVNAALADVAQNGFPQDQVDGVMASLKTSMLLIDEYSDPVNQVILQMAGGYANTGNPWQLQDNQDALLRMEDWNAQGLYAKSAFQWLTGCRTTALVTTFPEPGGKEAHDAALAEKLADIKAGMSKREIEKIVAATNAQPEKEDAAEYVAKLQAVTVESLPEEWKLYDVKDETGADGVRRIEAVAGVEGIGCADVFLDASGLAQEDIHWFKLYTDMLTELDTGAHTRAELARLISRYLYGGSLRLSLPEAGADGYHPYLRMSWIALDEDLDEGYDLMREILLDTKLDEPARLLEQVQALKANFRSRVTSDPYNVLVRRAAAVSNERYRYNTYASDLAYYDFLSAAEQLLQSDPDAAVAKLKDIQGYFNNRTNAVTMFAGNADSIALNRKLADQFLATLDTREIAPVHYDFPVPAKSEALVIDSNMQYNLLMADYAALGLDGFTGDMAAVVNLVNDTLLVPLLRDQYGVYTPEHEAMADDGILIYAYRDPNIAETFRVLEGLGDRVAGMEIDQETLNGYILSAYTGFAMPHGELSGALTAEMNALQGKPQDEPLTWMRQLKALTPEGVRGYGDLYAKLAENGLRRTAGGAAAVNGNAELFDDILNPFGGVDTSQVELADVNEGGEHYDAVRFAFEEGFMDPQAEGRFGVDAPATQGDLLAALYVLVGGELDADEALAAFTEYGLVTDDTDLSAPILPEDIWGLISVLVGQEVAPMTETAQSDAVTRGELAEALMAFVEDMA